MLKVQDKIQRRIGLTPSIIKNKFIESRLADGHPLITYDELHIERSSEKQACADIVDVFAAFPQLFGELPEALKKSGAGILHNAEVAETWFNGTPFPEDLLKNVAENDEILLQTMVQAAIKPFLSSHVYALKKYVDHKIIKNWSREYCPYCGGKADIAYLEKEVGARWLVCSRCDTDWPFPRLQCPFCLNQEQNMLSFFMDNTEQYRLQVCEKCKCYIKTIDLRKAKEEVLMPLERMLTIEMDRQAHEKGYCSC